MSTSPAWRDIEPEQFANAVTVAAAQLGVLPLAVEKDYWVCRALHAITLAHPGEVVFKGGTSLEKLRIIRRFSEDIDLLVIGSYESNRATERALKSMIRTAAEQTGTVPSGEQSGGKPGGFHRRAYLEPTLSHAGEQGAIADATAILVEVGQSGGPHPHRLRHVTSLLTRQLADANFEVSAWSDLVPFDVAILHPGRTLIEKLLRVNNFAADQTRQRDVHGWPRIGRQFYDVWALLGNEEVLEFLRDKTIVSEVLASCYAASRAFAPDLPIPTGGFAASPAFNRDGPLIERLRREHDIAMDTLYYGAEAPPTFDEILNRVHANHELLSVS